MQHSRCIPCVLHAETPAAVTDLQPRLLQLLPALFAVEDTHLGLSPWEISLSCCLFLSFETVPQSQSCEWFLLHQLGPVKHGTSGLLSTLSFIFSFFSPKCQPLYSTPGMCLSPVLTLASHLKVTRSPLCGQSRHRSHCP